MIEYCERWWIKKKRIVGSLTASTAKQCHASGDPYVAVLSDGDSVTHVVEVSDKYVAVQFFDDRVRSTLLYSFQRKSDKVFLISALCWKYTELNEDWQRRTHFTFKDDGSFHVEIADRIQDTTEERVGSANTAGNWADFPEFGEYDDLCKVERISLEDDFVADEDVS